MMTVISPTRSAFAVAAALVLSLPAFAAGAIGDSPAAALAQRPDFGQSNLQKNLAPFKFEIAAMPVELQKTELAEVAAKLGGKPSHQGDAGDSLDWLCYASPTDGAAPATLTWFFSGEMGGGTLIEQVAHEVAPAAIPASCTTLKAPIGLKIAVPGLGETKATLAKTFGSATEEQGAIDYFYLVTDEKTQTSTQSDIAYKLDGDKVIAFAVHYLQSN